LAPGFPPLEQPSPATSTRSAACCATDARLSPGAAARWSGTLRRHRCATSATGRAVS
jgi:hypothetical protein